MTDNVVKRLQREYASFFKEAPKDMMISVIESDIFQIHFSFRGSEDSDFEEGIYHGKFIFPREYPMKPPEMYFLNKSGRYEIDTKICLSMSSYHPETWTPTWTIRTMLEALRAFMLTPAKGAIGAVNTSSEVKRKLAKESISYKCPICGMDHSELDKLFPKKEKKQDNNNNNNDTNKEEEVKQEIKEEEQQQQQKEENENENIIIKEEEEDNKVDEKEDKIEENKTEEIKEVILTKVEEEDNNNNNNKTEEVTMETKETKMVEDDNDDFDINEILRKKREEEKLRAEKILQTQTEQQENNNNEEGDFVGDMLHVIYYSILFLLVLMILNYIKIQLIKYYYSN